MAMHDNNNTIIITMMIVGAGISIRLARPAFRAPDSKADCHWTFGRH